MPLVELYGEWKAWHESMPGKPPTLHVSGTCRIRELGWEAALRAVPSGFNPAIVRLELVVTSTSDVHGDQIDDQEINWSKERDEPVEQVEVFGEGIKPEFLDVDTTG